MEQKQTAQFPLCIFSDSIRQVIHDTNNDLNFPANYIAASLFFAISVAIGGSRKLVVKKGWETKAIIFMALLGKPGAVKTHPILFALAPLMELDKLSLEKYEKELSAFRKAGPDEKLCKPKAKQFIVQDITIEGLAKVHKDNPRGICIHADELRGWVSSFDRYKKGGGDQEQWLSLFNGKSVVINRKAQDDITYLPESFVSVIGGLQPGMLAKIFKGEKIENGFLFRLLFVNNSSEDQPVLWKDEDLPSNADEIWKYYLYKILSLCGYPDNPVQKTLRLSSDAWLSIKEWQNEREQNNYANEPDSTIAIFAKIQEYALRFCIIIHTMREASGQIEESDLIDNHTAILATCVADYFFHTAVDVYQYIIRGGDDPSKFFLLLNSLNKRFTTAQALAVCEKVGLSERSVFRYLDVKQDDPFIRKIKHGVYEQL